MRKKTFEAMLKLKEADASQVSRITKRVRAVESHYLNILVRKGYLEEERLGRRKIFKLPEKFQELSELYKEM